MTQDQLKLGNELTKRISECELRIASVQASLLVQPETDNDIPPYAVLRSVQLKGELALLDAAQKAFSDL